MVISQPEEDIQRERQRMAEAVPNATQSVGQLSVVPAEGSTPGGQRRRQEHARQQRHTRIGQYYLGQTLGEGEFGKVKLGWKQEGGVQVCFELTERLLLYADCCRWPSSS
jgi:protein-serine/threonine kinase